MTSNVDFAINSLSNHSDVLHLIELMRMEDPRIRAALSITTIQGVQRPVFDLTKIAKTIYEKCIDAQGNVRPDVGTGISYLCCFYHERGFGPKNKYLMDTVWMNNINTWEVFFDIKKLSAATVITAPRFCQVFSYLMIALDLLDESRQNVQISHISGGPILNHAPKMIQSSYLFCLLEAAAYVNPHAARLMWMANFNLKFQHYCLTNPGKPHIRENQWQFHMQAKEYPFCSREVKMDLLHAAGFVRLCKGKYYFQRKVLVWLTTLAKEVVGIGGYTLPAEIPCVNDWGDVVRLNIIAATCDNTPLYCKATGWVLSSDDISHEVERRRHAYVAHLMVKEDVDEPGDISRVRPRFEAIMMPANYVDGPHNYPPDEFKDRISGATTQFPSERSPSPGITGDERTARGVPSGVGEKRPFVASPKSGPSPMEFEESSAGPVSTRRSARLTSPGARSHASESSDIAHIVVEELAEEPTQEGSPEKRSKVDMIQLRKTVDNEEVANIEAHYAPKIDNLLQAVGKPGYIDLLSQLNIEGRQHFYISNLAVVTKEMSLYRRSNKRGLKVPNAKSLFKQYASNYMPYELFAYKLAMVMPSDKGIGGPIEFCQMLRDDCASSLTVPSVKMTDCYNQALMARTNLNFLRVFHVYPFNRKNLFKDLMMYCTPEHKAGLLEAYNYLYEMTKGEHLKISEANYLDLSYTLI